LTPFDFYDFLPSASAVDDGWVQRHRAGDPPRPFLLILEQMTGVL